MSQAQLARPNKRLARRRDAKTSLAVKCFKGTTGLGRNLALSILDVSETGVRLRVNCPLEPNQEIEVSLSATHQAKPIKALASVTWCIPAADGNYCIGASFRQRLNYADMGVITRYTLATDPLERKHPGEESPRPHLDRE